MTDTTAAAKARELLAAEFDGPQQYAGTAIDIQRGRFCGIPAERAVGVIERLILASEQRVKALEAALRIALWNEARGRGVSQDQALVEINAKIAALTRSDDAGS